MEMINVPLCRPDVGQEELNAIAEVFKSGQLSHGPQVKEFETAFAQKIGVRHAIALNSCTSGLFLLCLHIHDQRGHGEIIVPSFTFVASANAVVCSGMNPSLVDVAWNTGLVSAKQIEPSINEQTRGIMVVHYAGRSCPMDEIMNLAEKYNLPVIEDCAEALGVSFAGKQVGSFGHGVFSFYSTKNMTTGEGGMITTNDAMLADWVRLRVAHGVAKNTYSRNNVVQTYYRNAVVAGQNFRLSNFQAAMGLVQLKKLDGMNDRRYAVAQQYYTAFHDIPGLECPEFLPSGAHSYQMYPIKVKETIRDEFLEFLNASGIGASVHFDPPVHLQTAYSRAGFSLPVTEKLSRSTITLPISSVQTLEQTQYVIECIHKVFKQ